MMKKKANLNKAFRELRKLGYVAKQKFDIFEYNPSLFKAKKIVFSNKLDARQLAQTGECFLAWSGDRDEIAEVLERNGVLKTKPENEAKRFEISIN